MVFEVEERERELTVQARQEARAVPSETPMFGLTLGI